MEPVRRRVNPVTLPSAVFAAFAIVCNALAVVICLAGFMSPLLAAILMPESWQVSLAIVFAGFSVRRGARVREIRLVRLQCAVMSRAAGEGTLRRTICVPHGMHVPCDPHHG